jgi:hypothetical protein
VSAEDELLDFLPALDALHTREMVAELVHLVLASTEEVEVLDVRDQVSQHLETVVDEVRDAELLADPGLVLPLAAEVHSLRTEPRPLVEAVMLEPAQGLVLDLLPALGDDVRVLAELEIDEPLHGLDGVGRRGGVEEVLCEERGVRIVVDAIHDHAPDIDTDGVQLNLPFCICLFGN